MNEHKVTAHAGQQVTVKIYGDMYTVTLDDKATAELVLFGQSHTITGELKVKEVKKVKHETPKAK